jgi:hypothetical protein
MRAKPVPSNRSKEDYLSHLELAMNPEVYLEAFGSTVDIRMDKIRQERQALKEKLMRDCENQLWLDGIDRIEKASSDLGQFDCMNQFQIRG